MNIQAIKAKIKIPQTALYGNILNADKKILPRLTQADPIREN